MIREKKKRLEIKFLTKNRLPHFFSKSRSSWMREGISAAVVVDEASHHYHVQF